MYDNAFIIIYQSKAKMCFILQKKEAGPLFLDIGVVFNDK